MAPARHFFLAALLLSLLAAGLCRPASGAFAEQFSSAGDGIKLLDFTIASPRPARLGHVAKIVFTLKNTSSKTLTFDRKFGIFVGVRWKSERHKKLNRDFGHTFQGLKLKPGQAITVKTDKILDMPGTWDFWPAYRLEGHWGRLDAFKKRLLVSH